MKSIRIYLLLFLAASLLAATAVIGVLVYVSTRNEINEMYSYHLFQLGQLLSEQQSNLDNCGWPGPAAATAEAPRHRIEESEFVIQVWNPQGALLHTSHPQLQLPLQTRAGFVETLYGTRPWQIFRVDNAHCILQIAQPESARREAIREITHHILGPALMQLPLLGILIWFAVGHGLKPLARLSMAIRTRSAVALEPVEEKSLPKEVKPLVRALNDLFGRLDVALRAQRQFTADAAHELRSPLSALQLQLQLAQRATTDAERARALTQLAAGIQRGNRLVQQLLTLARLEPEAPLKSMQPTALDELTRNVVGEFAPQALAKNIDIGVERCDAATINGDRDGLEILLGNLIDNAIRYTPVGGRIDVSVTRNADCAFIDVADNGTGIPAAERERVFDRFYRVEGSGATTGTGLGLAIVRAITERHGGSILVLDNPANLITRGGTLMRLILPLDAE